MMDNNLALLNAIYQNNPASFTDDEVYNLEKQNQFYGINFQRDQSVGDTNLGNIITNLVDGFVQGFTTIDPGIGEQPMDTWSSISRSVGHLLGFIGIVPGVGSVGSLLTKGVGGIVKGVGVGLKAGKVIGAGAKISSFQLKSGPMMVADAVTEYGKLNLASRTVGNYVGKAFTNEAIGIGTGSILQAGTHLGIASAVSSWQEGTDMMMESFGHGFVMGGAFRGLAHLLPSAKIPDSREGLFKMFKEQAGDPKGLARILSSTIFSGLPSTARDEPIELQIYNYLLGAYFGATEMPSTQRKALEEFYKMPYKSAWPFPESFPRWSEIGKEPGGKQVQAEMIRQAKLMQYKALKIQGEIFGEGGIAFGQAFNELKIDAFKKLEERRPTLSSKEYQNELHSLNMKFLGREMANEIEVRLKAEVDKRKAEIEAGKISEAEVRDEVIEKVTEDVRQQVRESLEVAQSLQKELQDITQEEYYQKTLEKFKDTEAGK